MVLRAVSRPFTLTAIPRGFEAEVFMHWIPFLLPNQQCQSTEGKNECYICLHLSFEIRKCVAVTQDCFYMLIHYFVTGSKQ